MTASVTLPRIDKIRYIGRLCSELRVAAHIVKHIAPKVLLSIRANSRHQVPSARQSTTSVDLSSRVADSAEDVKAYIVSRGIHYAEGRHTIYVPPQPALVDLLGGLPYPSDAGLRIQKAICPSGKASYLSNGSKRWVTSQLMGGITNQVDAANALYVMGLGPRFYDLVEIVLGNGVLTGMAVQHVNGTAPDSDDHALFLGRLHESLADPVWRNCVAPVPHQQWEHPDFSAPDCSGNLLKRVTDGKLIYIDPQQFRIINRDLVIHRLFDRHKAQFHFGKSRSLRRGQRYLYQSVPGVESAGKRDTSTRWAAITGMLSAAGYGIQDRVVLDVGCNAGMMMAEALHDGARWAVGWDLPPVAKAAEEVQCMLGNTRTTFAGAQLNAKYPLSRDVPDWLSGSLNEAVVLYLAVWQHVGLIEDLARMPWRVLVLEGHEGDSQEQLESLIHKVEAYCGCQVVGRLKAADGDCGARTIAAFVRG